MTHINYIMAAYTIAFVCFAGIIMRTSLIHFQRKKLFKAMLKHVNES